MQTENLTNPGKEPVDGDLIRNRYDNGATEEKQYWASPEVTHQTIRTLTKLQYLQRFTQAERIAIRAAGKVNAVVNDYIELLNATDAVHLDAPDTISGLQALTDAGILAPGRMSEILA